MPGFPRYGAAPRVLPVPPFAPTDGGGATTFAPGPLPDAARELVIAPLVPDAFIDAGGGTTFAAKDVPELFEPPRESTLGGGGTTSLAPKIFPMMLLISDPLPDAEGGGGTTVLPESGTVPPDRWRMSADRSADGGGATTEGAGKFSFAFRFEARSGADTGGGTTPVFVICTGALEMSRLTAPGAGGITFPGNAGLDRPRSRVTLGAGATTDASRLGAIDLRSRVTRGAGATTAGANAGATSACSFGTFGAGAIRFGLKTGDVSVRSRVTFGAGAITDSIWMPLRV